MVGVFLSIKKTLYWIWWSPLLYW